MSVDVESEAMLEDKFIKQLQGMGYEFIKIKNEEELNANFKIQLEKLNKKELNGKPLTDDEFERILIYLDSGSVFDKADKLRDEYTIKRDNEMSVSIKFLNQKDWCKNIFQVSNQITMRGTHENRYDVTILINGLPLVQVELKRRSIAISEAFNQVKRYMKTSYKNLFGYIQIFIVSNGLYTKYFANGRPNDVDFGYTFYWKDKDNNNIYPLNEFTEDFLEKCNIAKMISKFMVLNESTKELMVLRAYQKYAVDAVLTQALENKKNGYVYHTTGSGKTLTSFKVSQLLAEEPSIYKVIFVVDRRDLNDQTNKEFNKFCPKCIGTSEHTGALVKNLLSDKNPLITTTIQKLAIAVNRKHTRKKLEKIKDKNIIFIYDECHRSQFGKMQQDISNFFKNSLSYGFTGTPIFEENAMGHKTTKTIFGERLHTYMIKDAIADYNVLGFSIDYYNTLKIKEGVIDEKVPSIKINEAYAHKDRLNLIVDHILDSYNVKTKDREFNAIFAVSQKTKDNPTGFIHDYYKLFKEKKIKRNKNESFIYKNNTHIYERVGKNGDPICIDDEIPFDIPDNWEWTRIKNIVTKLTDGAHKTPKYVDKGIPFLSVKDMSSGYLDFSDTKYISQEDFERIYQRCNYEYGDILLTKVGTTGIPIIIDTNKDFGLFVSVALLKFNHEFIYNEFLVHLINSPLVQLQCIENTKGVGNKNWVLRDIGNTLITIPPLNEQIRIVEKLEEIFQKLK